MKISQREKTMLIVLCIVLIGALVFMLALKPLIEQKTILEAELKEVKSEWEDITKPVTVRFRNVRDAEQLWQSSGALFVNNLNNLIYNGNYLLGCQITELMAEAAYLGDDSILPRMTKHDLTSKIFEEFINDHIIINTYDPSPITDVEYSLGDENYLISICRMSFAGFSSVGNDPDSFFMMLDKMEKSGYIVVETWAYNPNDNTGNISFVILMTRGDLSQYSVVQCPKSDCLEYNIDSAINCKYCNTSLVHEHE